MKTVITSDWAPHIETTARRLAQVLVAVYCLGWSFGRWLHRQNDRLAGRTTPAPQPMITQRLAAVATPTNIAPPTLVHISDPIARAAIREVAAWLRDDRSDFGLVAAAALLDDEANR